MMVGVAATRFSFFFFGIWLYQLKIVRVSGEMLRSNSKTKVRRRETKANNIAATATRLKRRQLYKSAG